ncbi:MAG: rod shape-determining protein [Candidatus Yanofskybacteria bacterium]|nr:rod shape-determining protein [Candidatus Yanofskybacteria bacterium]
MLSKIFGYWSKDLGIDLGTANTLVYVRGRGIVINEPSIVAVNQKTGKILAIGTEARKMVGRTPGYISVTRPLISGVVSDFEVTEQMLKFFIDKVHQGNGMALMPRPRVVVGIPSGVTEVEKRAVEDATYSAGAREVYLIEEPMAAAIGSRLPIHDAVANVIIDMGGGTTEVAIISMGGLIASRSVRVAGDKLNEDITRYLREERNLLIGEATAENLKMMLGSAFPLEEELEGKVRGRDLVSGLPKEILVTSEEMREAMERSIKLIVGAIKDTIEETPPELTADLVNKQIYLSGGGALIRGLDKYIAQEVKLIVKVVEDPLTAVVRGCGVVLEDVDKLKPVLVSTNKESFAM